MKIYTINATPMRRWDQLEAPGVGKLDFRKRDIDAINETAVQLYPKEVAAILAKHGIDGFTIYEVQGYWKGKAERSFKIEVATDRPDKIVTICDSLRDTWNQDAVMLTRPSGDVEFV